MTPKESAGSIYRRYSNQRSVLALVCYLSCRAKDWAPSTTLATMELVVEEAVFVAKVWGRKRRGTKLQRSSLLAALTFHRKTPKPIFETPPLPAFSPTRCNSFMTDVLSFHRRVGVMTLRTHLTTTKISLVTWKSARFLPCIIYHLVLCMVAAGGAEANPSYQRARPNTSNFFL